MEPEVSGNMKRQRSRRPEKIQISERERCKDPTPGSRQTRRVHLWERVAAGEVALAGRKKQNLRPAGE